MPSIRELKTVWQIRFKNRSRKPLETTVSLDKEHFPTRRVAEEEAKRLDYLYKYENYDPWTMDRPGEGTGQLVLGEAVKEYCQSRREAGLRGERGGWTAKTLAGSESLFDHFARQVGQGKHVERITTADLAAYIHQSHLAHATKRSYRKKVSAFLNWLERQGYDMCDLPPPLEKRELPPEWISEDELYELCERFVQLWEGEYRLSKHAAWGTMKESLRLTEVFRFAFYNGMRIGEIVGLEVRDVDFDRGAIRIRKQKNKRDQTIPMMEPAAHVLRPFALGKSRRSRVFGYKSTSYVSEKFREARRSLWPGRERLSVHNLRDSFAVYWLKRDVSIYRVKEVLRHSSVKVTEDHYADMLMQDVGRQYSERWEKNNQGWRGS